MPVVAKPQPPKPDVQFAKAIDAMVRFIWTDYPRIEAERTAKERRQQEYKKEFQRRGIA